MKPYDALTCDCSGTLIDWYGGVRAAAGEMRALRGIDMERFVRDRDAADRQLIAQPYRPYSEIVAESARRAALAQSRALSDGEAQRFAASMARWPPFAESHASLVRLASNYRLAILSNVDTATLEASVAMLDVPFELVVTAEMLRSYKPRHAHWVEALARLKIARSRVLHVGCSLFHDIRPAHALGFPTAFVDREGEPLQPGDEPTLTVPDLARLCAELI
ncbi:MAG TPA: HAD hydrolase-like protein [Planctomycetota bacterium]|nr:HAD hydrolase-like protein [Planctomycetota bacterium]